MERNDKMKSAAALMVLLGADLAASVMQHLEEEEVHRISSAISKIEGREVRYLERLGELFGPAGAPGDAFRMS